MGVTTYLKNSIAENLFRRTPGFYRRYRDLLARSETMSFMERRQLREELTAATLKIARTTPHGQAVSAGAGYDDWPILEKESLRENPDACSARTIIPAHPAATGGTTGVPILLRRSLQSVVFEQATLDHLVESRSGVCWQDARIAILRGDTFKSPQDMTPPHWQLRQGGRHLASSSIHLNPKTINDFISAIEDFRPDILWVYPSALEAFVRLGAASLAAGGISNLKLVVSSSEVLDSAVQRDVSKILGVPVLDFYGQSERVCASFHVQDGEHYFVPAYGRVELLHAHDDGDHSFYEVIGTSYWNKAQPLVRFRTGDLAKLDKGLSTGEIDAITLGLLPFHGIEGRRSEYVLSPEGSRIIGINHIPRNIPDIARMQIVQTGVSTVEIRVVPLESFGEATVAAILANARQKLPPSMDVTVSAVDTLVHTAAGKAPLVVRLEPQGA